MDGKPATRGELLVWTAQVCLLASLVLFWSCIPINLRAAIVCLITAFVLLALWAWNMYQFNGLMQVLPASAAQLLESSLLEYFQGSVLRQHLPELAVLMILPLSSGEQRMVLNRLPDSIQYSLRTKLINLFPATMRKVLLPPEKRSDVPDQQLLPIQRKRFEDLPELNKNVMVQVIIYRLWDSWRAKRTQVISYLWYMSSFALFVAIIRLIKGHRNIHLKSFTILWLAISSFKRMSETRSDIVD